MSYGSSTFSGAAFGGSANSANEQVILPYADRIAGVEYEGIANFSGPEQFYAVYTRQGTESIICEYRIYSASGPGETPQLQTIAGGGGPTESIIGANAIIVVRAQVTDIDNNQFGVFGRPYTQ